MHKRGTYRWSSGLLNEVAEKINNNINRSTRMKPVDITPMNKADVLDMRARKEAKLRKIPKKSYFNVGDFVRISKARQTFMKSAEIGYSMEVFVVAQVLHSNIEYYKLKDENFEPIEGYFTRHELVHVSDSELKLVEKILKKKGNKVYVKYLGLDQKEWIDSVNVFDLNK